MHFDSIIIRLKSFINIYFFFDEIKDWRKSATIKQTVSIQKYNLYFMSFNTIEPRFLVVSRLYCYQFSLEPINKRKSAI